MSGAYTPQTAMFIFAHPDDIEFGVAGTAAKWARAGSRVIYVVITDGNVGSHEDGMTPERLAEIRRAEQTAAGQVAGAECLFLGYHDGFLQPTLELRKDLVRLIRQYRPDAVVCGDPSNYFPAEDYINHPDHRAAAQAALDAVFPAAEMTLLYPDLAAEGLVGHKVNYVFVSFGERVNHFVDITDTIDLKIEALQKHVSQLGQWNPADMIRQWAADTGKKVGFAYAEGFYRITLQSLDTPATAQPEI
ncbi:putative deacetylase [Candidatus Promineifilum breve]|uniref:Deacetylase n=1 Tax=Candidatus Promineifilum breve TaxID=1806508 RepID=A0A160T6Q3_9CHLR|nr:PIG-L deacetylase family protein [Candidatus Promineifilum breve]CUS05239.2 putative deacetylase [Candidatus Promineifilum breve]